MGVGVAPEDAGAIEKRGVTDAGVITASGDDVCAATVAPTMEESERIAQITKAILAVADAWRFAQKTRLLLILVLQYKA